MAKVKANPDVAPIGTHWAYLTSFSAVNLLTHAQGNGKPARAIHVLDAGSGGLVVVKPDGNTETLAGLFAGFQLAGQVQTITSGTIAKAIVYW